MFEHHIENAIALLTQQTIGDGSSVHLKTILAAPVPASIKRVFEADAERWREAEMSRLLASEHFDYSDINIRKMFGEIGAASLEYTRFTRDEFVATLDATVKLLFNYVCRPQWTLVKYIFSEADALPTEHLLEHMRHFTDYDYYAVVMREYARAKRIDTLTKEKFEEFLTLIDAEVVRNLDSSKLARLSQPIFAAFNPGDDSDYACVPVEALSIFYDDKNITSVVNRLETEKERTPMLSLYDLIMIVGETDFTAGVEISEIVTRHIGGVMVAPEEIEDLGGEFDIAPAAADIAELPSGTLDSYLDLEPELEVPVEEDVTLSFDAEPDALAGEQNTPDFSLFEEEEAIPAQEAAVNDDDISVPDGLFIEQQAVQNHTDIAPELGKTLAGLPVMTTDADDDDFFKQLDLTDEDFLTPAPGAGKEEDIPDINLDHVELPKQPAMEQPEAVVAAAIESPARTDETILPPGEHAGANHEMPFLEQRADEDEEQKTPEEIIASLGDLRKQIDAGNKKLYAKKLFGKDDDAFEATLDVLNGKATWREASDYIDEIFLSHNVDMYSRIAVTFTDDIYRRYQKKK